MNYPLYHIEKLKHCYGGKLALDIDRLSISRKSIIGLAGPNGSGKSTLLKLLGCINRPTSGDMRFNGKPAIPFSDEVRFHVTFLPQEPYLMKRTVFSNVEYGLKLRGDTHDIQPRVHRALEKVGLSPSAFSSRYWHELSGGEAQRVALAARLVLKPQVLLLDEPTASVDAGSVQLIKEASLYARRRWGTTLVIASHDMDWLDDVCDEILYLFRGRVIGSGKGNIVFGPWRSRDDGMFEKTLENGQLFIVPRPPDEDAVAVLDSDSLTLHDEKNMLSGGNHVHEIKGVVTRMNLEQRTGKVIITVSSGNLKLSVRIDPDSGNEKVYQPGGSAVIRYLPSSLRWVGSNLS